MRRAVVWKENVILDGHHSFLVPPYTDLLSRRFLRVWVGTPVHPISVVSRWNSHVLCLHSPPRMLPSWSCPKSPQPTGFKESLEELGSGKSRT